MRTSYLLFIFFILTFTGISFAQSTRDVKPKDPPPPAYQATKKEKKGFLGIFKKKEEKTVFNKSREEEVAEFRARLKEVYKEKAKEAKKAEDPQYSNPLYFGHKKPPKKRPPDKMKFCKECGLKH